MALKKCKECRKPVSTQASTCPHCGVPNPIVARVVAPPRITSEKDQDWGKTLLISVAALLVLIMVAGSYTDRSERRAVESKAQADSVAAYAVLANPDTVASGRLLQLDPYFHFEGIAHDAIHKRVIESRIASLKDALSSQRTTRSWVNNVAGLVSSIDTTYSVADRKILSNGRATLKGIERKVVAKEEAAELQAGIAARKAYAPLLEQQFLDARLDVSVTTNGNSHTTLRMKNVLFGRVAANDLGKNSGFWETVRILGFKKVIMTDGYDDTWSWDVK